MTRFKAARTASSLPCLVSLEVGQMPWPLLFIERDYLGAQGPHRSFSKLIPEGKSTQYAPYLDIGDFSQLLPGRK